MKPKKNSHPGIIITQQMKDADMTMKDLAFLLEKSYHIVHAVVRGNRPISIDFAQRCALIFGVSPQLYLNAQNDYDLGNFPISRSTRNKIEERYFKEYQAFKANKSTHKLKCGRKWVNG
jgi:addiction module HigA family antidote